MTAVANGPLDVAFEGIENSCQVLRELNEPLKESIKLAITEIPILLTREEAYEYVITWNQAGSPGGGYQAPSAVPTREELEEWLKVVYITDNSCEPAVQSYQRQLTPAAQEANDYAKDVFAFKLEGGMMSYDGIIHAIETPLTLGEVIVSLATTANSIYSLATRVNESSTGVVTKHPVQWRGTGFDGYKKTRDSFEARLNELRDIALKIAKTAADMISSIEVFLTELAGIGAAVRSSLLKAVSGLKSALNPLSWLDILTSFATFFTDRQATMEDVVASIASVCKDGIKQMVDMLDSAIILSSEWPIVDPNISGSEAGPGWEEINPK